MKTPSDANLPLSEQTYFILLSLQTVPKHGYAIARDVRSLSNGRVNLSVSTLYTTLKRLLDVGWIRPVDEISTQSNRPRKIYDLTNMGRKALQLEIQRLNALIAAARTRGVEGAI